MSAPVSCPRLRLPASGRANTVRVSSGKISKPPSMAKPEQGGDNQHRRASTEPRIFAQIRPCHLLVDHS